MSDTLYDEIIPRLKKNYIYEIFQSKCDADNGGDHAKVLLKESLAYAYQKSKTIISCMPEFTLHDGDHLFNVLSLMEKILTKENIDQLYLPELLLLLMSAFFHDLGMAPNEETIIGKNIGMQILHLIILSKNMNIMNLENFV